MGGDRPVEGDAAIRALRAAQEEVEVLRGGSIDPNQARGYILRVANAVDRSLRRMLRDDDAAELDLRLKALAPDELRSDSVLAELRRNERIPMELAAGIHDLLEMRRRLEGGTHASDADRTRAVRVFDQLARTIEQGPAQPTPTVAAPPPAPPADVFEDDAVPVSSRRQRRGGSPVPMGALAALLVLLLVGAGAYFMFGTSRGLGDMEQGIALFRTGAYAEAAQHFFRYAEANPRDPTPHLYLARIHRRMERPQLAADALREAQNLAPEDPAVHRELGFLLLDQGRPEVAVDRFRHAIELEEESSEAWVGLIRALRESGRDAEVDRELQRAPAEVRALLNRPAAG